MYRVSFWSELLGKIVVKEFDDVTEATEFARAKNGILICA